jgi:hypothetical protein
MDCSECGASRGDPLHKSEYTSSGLFVETRENWYFFGIPINSRIKDVRVYCDEHDPTEVKSS